MNLTAAASLVAFLSAGSLVSAQPEATTSPSGFPDVVARVNGTDITKSMLLRRADALRNQLPSSEVREDFYHRVLDDMVSGELLYQSGEKKGYAPTEADVDAEIESQKTRMGGAAEFDKVLVAQGIVLEDLRVELKKEIAVQSLIEKEFIPAITVSEEEKRAFYAENQVQMSRPEQFRCAHILIGIPPTATEEQKTQARQKAASLRSMIEAGQDFADLARRNSDDPGSKDNGGELPWMSKGQTVPPFEAAALALEPGGLSDVVETQYGFHIIRLLEKRGSGVVSYEEVEPRLDEFLKRRALQNRIEVEIEALTAQGTVELFI
jgi:peptidyl-prolyl cis-trans isomerase C